MKEIKFEKSEFDNNSDADFLLREKGEYVSLTAGASMRPIFREHRDVVVIRTIKNPLKKGDAVLYPETDGKYILHRIMRFKGDICIIRGDNNFFTERVKKENIIGVLTEFYRDGKYVKCDENFKYKCYVFYICHSYWVRYIWRKWLLPTVVKIKRAVFNS